MTGLTGSVRARMTVLDGGLFTVIAVGVLLGALTTSPTGAPITLEPRR
jgi:hypothetical protein